MRNCTDLALVRLRLPPAANLSGKLAQSLLVFPPQDNSRRYWCLGLNIFGDTNEYGMCEAEFHIQPLSLFGQGRWIVLQLSSVADSNQLERENEPLCETLDGVCNESAA